MRRSVGVALGKIGTAASVKFLTPLLRDSDPQVRAEVARGLSGKDLTALAMPLVNAVGEEEDEAVRDELYRALGRIGTASAVQALINAARPGGLLLKRRGATDRLAAVEGLGLAGGEAAVQALESLGKDRDRQVRDEARKALAQARIRRSRTEQTIPPP